MPKSRLYANVVDVESPWLTMEGLIKYLGGVSQDWIEKHILIDRNVHKRKVGRRVIVKKAEIDRFIERHKIA